MNAAGQNSKITSKDPCLCILIFFKGDGEADINLSLMLYGKKGSGSQWACSIQVSLFRNGGFSSTGSKGRHQGTSLLAWKKAYSDAVNCPRKLRQIPQPARKQRPQAYNHKELNSTSNTSELVRELRALDEHCS